MARSVRDSEGFSVYDSITAQIDWDEPHPWLALLGRLNDSQRAVVAVAQVHEHAAFNGVQETLAFHGPEVFRIAIRGASALGCRGERHGLLHRRVMRLPAVGGAAEASELDDVAVGIGHVRKRVFRVVLAAFDDASARVDNGCDCLVEP